MATQSLQFTQAQTVFLFAVVKSRMSFCWETGIMWECGNLTGSALWLFVISGNPPDPGPVSSADNQWKCSKGRGDDATSVRVNVPSLWTIACCGSSLLVPPDVNWALTPPPFLRKANTRCGNSTVVFKRKCFVS